MSTPMLTDYHVVDERVDEQRQLVTYVNDFLANGTGRLVYINGVPGSGKTYTVRRTLSGCVRMVYVNCARIRGRHALARALTRGSRRGHRRGRTNTNSTNSAMLAQVTGRILVIDEIDFLTSRDNAILYTLFELKHSNLLICISNTMVITADSKLASRIDTTIAFAAYDARRLCSIAGRAGMEVVARRVAAVSGDARRMLRLAGGCEEGGPVYARFVGEMDSGMVRVLRMGRMVYEHGSGMEYYEYVRVVDELRRMGLVRDGMAVLTEDEVDCCTRSM